MQDMDKNFIVADLHNSETLIKDNLHTVRFDEKLNK